MGRNAGVRDASALGYLRSCSVGGLSSSRRAWYPQSRRTTSPPRPTRHLRSCRNVEPVIKLIEKYSNVPIGFADACLVRMTETLADPFILTTDQDFRVYRRTAARYSLCDSRMICKLAWQGAVADREDSYERASSLWARILENRVFVRRCFTSACHAHFLFVPIPRPLSASARSCVIAFHPLPPTF